MVAARSVAPSRSDANEQVKRKKGARCSRLSRWDINEINIVYYVRRRGRFGREKGSRRVNDTECINARSAGAGERGFKPATLSVIAVIM